MHGVTSARIVCFAEKGGVSTLKTVGANLLTF